MMYISMVQVNPWDLFGRDYEEGRYNSENCRIMEIDSHGWCEKGWGMSLKIIESSREWWPKSHDVVNMRKTRGRHPWIWSLLKDSILTKKIHIRGLWKPHKNFYLKFWPPSNKLDQWTLMHDTLQDVCNHN